jgi:hypothetical protein
MDHEAIQTAGLDPIIRTLKFFGLDRPTILDSGITNVLSNLHLHGFYSYFRMDPSVNIKIPDYYILRIGQGILIRLIRS